VNRQTSDYLSDADDGPVVVDVVRVERGVIQPGVVYLCVWTRMIVVFRVSRSRHARARGDT
jgi:hypothetical protein